MKKIILLSLIMLTIGESHGQDTLLRTYKVGIFAPVYLDSVFAGTNYRYNQQFPRFTLQGLEFMQGAMIALDSLTIYKGNIKASFYDTKSFEQNIQNLIVTHEIDSLDLMIGSVRDKDFSQLADFALKKNIPFISATYPNDGGITNNPFTVIVNSTLKAHCEAIYAHILQNHGNEKIYLVKKQGSQEDKIAGYFKTINEQEGKPLVQIETFNARDYNFGPLLARLDSTKENIIIGGSLEETFVAELITTLMKAKNKEVKLFGMPNWDGFVLGNKVKDYPFYFTTPYYNFKTDSYSQMLRNAYMEKYKSNPSDMVHKGFEATYIFCSLLTRYPYNFMSHLNDYTTKIFSDYNFKPVFSSKRSLTPSYFENKFLYFVKVKNGVFTHAW